MASFGTKSMHMCVGVCLCARTYHVMTVFPDVSCVVYRASSSVSPRWHALLDNGFPSLCVTHPTPRPRTVGSDLDPLHSHEPTRTYKFLASRGGTHQHARRSPPSSSHVQRGVPLVIISLLRGRDRGVRVRVRAIALGLGIRINLGLALSLELILRT